MEVESAQVEFFFFHCVHLNNKMPATPKKKKKQASMAPARGGGSAGRGAGRGAGGRGGGGGKKKKKKSEVAAKMELSLADALDVKYVMALLLCARASVCEDPCGVCSHISALPAPVRHKGTR